MAKKLYFWTVGVLLFVVVMFYLGMLVELPSLKWVLMPIERWFLLFLLLSYAVLGRLLVVFNLKTWGYWFLELVLLAVSISVAIWSVCGIWSCGMEIFGVVPPLLFAFGVLVVWGGISLFLKGKERIDSGQGIGGKVKGKMIVFKDRILFKVVVGLIVIAVILVIAEQLWGLIG